MKQKENAENSPACLYLDLEVHRLLAFFFICKNLLFVLYMLSRGFSYGGKDGESMSTPSFLEADVIAGPFFNHHFTNTDIRSEKLCIQNHATHK